jgi:RNA 3'-terminal phosphate cyclase (ATP)
MLAAPHQHVGRRKGTGPVGESAAKRITLDGSHGEGGGQILRTALTLSLLTGRPFRIVRIRANRDRPGLRPQHLAAVEAAARLSDAEVSGGTVGSRELIFRPGAVEPRDLDLDIGTAGATALVLHTLHLPLALKAGRPVRLRLTGGTFNTRAPSYPFLAGTWTRHMAALGLKVAVAMPRAGFYPQGGGQLDAWIEPGQPRPILATERGALTSIRGIAGIANLPGRSIAERMRDRAIEVLAGRGLAAEIELAEWSGVGRGAALSLTAEHEGAVPATFVGLGERGKPSEAVADDALAELLAHEAATGALDPHSADQVLLPLALAEGRSIFTVSDVTEHLRTNAATIRAFLDRPIRIDEEAGCVVVG